MMFILSFHFFFTVEYDAHEIAKSVLYVLVKSAHAAGVLI